MHCLGTDGLLWAFCFENFQGPFKILQNIIICTVTAVPFCLVHLPLLSSLMGPAVVFAWCLVVEKLVGWCPAPWWCLMVEDAVFGGLLQGPHGGGQAGALSCSVTMAQGRNHNHSQIYKHMLM